MKYSITLPLLLVAALFIFTACSGKAPSNLGASNGTLPPCPDLDNCVSSQATDIPHNIAPIQAKGDPDIVMVRLSRAIESMFGSKIITIEDNYLHAEFTSRIFRFVDDLECVYDREAGLIQIRSASRLGYSDLNANRKRVEELRAIFTSMQ